MVALLDVARPLVMSVRIFDSSVPHVLTPLGDDISRAAVGGRSFADAQRGALGDGDWAIAENAWIHSHDVDELDRSGNAVLIDRDGHEMVRIGAGEQQITASEQSFFVRFSWDLLEVNAQILASYTTSGGDGDVHRAAHVDGVLRVGKGTRVLPGVYIEGTVIIGKNCKIGPNCYIRGATSIGDGCHVGQSVEIKNTILGEGTNVGHLSYVGDSVLGAQVNLGAGTTTSNLRHDGSNHRSEINGAIIDTGRRKFGTIIGDGVHTGIHTAIYPGRKLGEGSSTLPNSTVTRDLPAGGSV